MDEQLLLTIIICVLFKFIFSNPKTERSSSGAFGSTSQGPARRPVAFSGDKFPTGAFGASKF